MTLKFVSISIQKVAMTLVEAMALVFIVMFIFLQNWRYTVIPSIVVPIALLGTFAVMLAAGHVGKHFGDVCDGVGHRHCGGRCHCGGW